MQLFIRVKDGKPFEHPITEQNFREAFPDIDVNNLPPNFMKFVRVPQPKVGPYQIYEGVSYEIVDGVCFDVHQFKQMTVEQMVEKQNRVKADWAAGGWVSWTFDEETCSFKPPFPAPDDGKFYKWDEGTTSWIEVVL